MRRRGEALLGALALVGGATLAFGFARAPREAALSYLVAYAYAFTTVVGMLMLTAMAHLTRSRWFVLVRRLAEALVGTLPLLALLFLPILFTLGSLYPWLDPGSLEVDARDAVLSRGGFQTAPAFAARAGAYLVAVTVAGEALVLLSRRQERRDPERSARAMRIASPAVLVVAAVVLTASAFDWLMSIEPGYYSDVFGVYAFAGGFLAALASLAVAGAVARRLGVVPKELGPRHFHALGTLVFAFVIFWTYIAFCQFMLGYAADLPHEARHHLLRTRGGYVAYAVALVIAHFAVPFVLLLFRAVKERAWALAAVCSLLALAHYADLHFMLTPALRPEGPRLTVLDVTAFVAVASAVALGALVRFRAMPAVPRRDPYFEESLTYRGVP